MMLQDLVEGEGGHSCYTAFRVIVNERSSGLPQFLYYIRSSKES